MNEVVCADKAKISHALESVCLLACFFRETIQQIERGIISVPISDFERKRMQVSVK